MDHASTSELTSFRHPRPGFGEIELAGWFCILAVILAVSAYTGYWRLALRPFCIRAKSMTTDQLGFTASDEKDIATINGVGLAFAGGFNRRVSDPSPTAWREFVDDVPALYRPFAEEGAAMGYPMRALWGFSPSGFEAAVVEPRTMYCYLHFVGLGFWSAMRHHDPKRVAKLVSQVDTLHGPLCWDGYGFRFGFFDYDRREKFLAQFASFPDYAANVAHQGYGRSLWFRFMGDNRRLMDAVRETKSFAADTASGVGLASAFTMIDRLDRAFAAIQDAPEEWRTDIAVGMTFAFKARQLSAAKEFDGWVSCLDADRIACIQDAIGECDAIEQRIRGASVSDCYQTWRADLKTWLAENIDYPFVARRTGRADSATTTIEPIHV